MGANGDQHSGTGDGPGSFNPANVAKGAGWLAAAHGLSFLLKLAVIPILTRLLVPEEFGIIAASLALVMLIAIVGGRGGLSSAVVVFHRTDPDAWRSAYTLTLAIAALAAVVIIALSPYLSALMGIPGATPYLVAVALLTPAILATEFQSIYLVTNGQYKTDSQGGLVAEILAAGAAIAAAFAGLGAWALVLQQVIAQLVRLLIFTWATKLYPALRPRFDLLKPMLPYTAKSTAGEMINFLAIQGPVIIVTRGLGAASTGLFGIANRLTSLPGDIILHSLARMLFPAFAELKSQEERARAVIWSGTANTFLMLPVLFGIAAVAGPLTRVILGPEFAGAAGIMAGLAFSKALTAPCVGLYAFMKAVDRTGTLMWLLAVRAALILGGVIIGMMLAGLDGVGLGIALSGLPGLVASYLTVRMIVPFRWVQVVAPFLRIAGPGLAMLVAVSAYVWWGEGQGMHDTLLLVTAVALGAALYAILLTLTFRRVVTGFLARPAESGGFAIAARFTRAMQRVRPQNTTGQA